MAARIVVDAGEVERSAAAMAAEVGPSERELLRELAIQALRGARKRANGPADGTVSVKRGKLPGAGNYPIPVRTGTFGRGFGMRTLQHSAIVFNDTVYAGALHDGFRPYGNTKAMVIPARPYFNDALEQDLDIDAAHANWERRMQRAADRAAQGAAG